MSPEPAGSDRRQYERRESKFNSAITLDGNGFARAILDISPGGLGRLMVDTHDDPDYGLAVDHHVRTGVFSSRRQSRPGLIR